MKVLITGRAGSGKSSVAHELKRRGFIAFDTDAVPKLSAWYDKTSRKKVLIKNNKYVSTEYEWLWDKKILKSLVAKYDNIFICGGADNDLDFDDIFDKHFVLDVEPHTQKERLLNRLNNVYGKDPAMHDRIITEQALHVAATSQRHAIIIDANQPIEKVVNDIVGYCT